MASRDRDGVKHQMSPIVVMCQSRPEMRWFRKSNALEYFSMSLWTFNMISGPPQGRVDHTQQEVCNSAQILSKQKNRYSIRSEANGTHLALYGQGTNVRLSKTDVKCSKLQSWSAKCGDRISPLQCHSHWGQHDLENIEFTVKRSRF